MRGEEYVRAGGQRGEGRTIVKGEQGGWASLLGSDGRTAWLRQSLYGCA